MPLLTWARLGVAAPFDPDHAFVTSPFLPRSALAALRALLALYALCTVITDLVLAVRDGAGHSFLSYFTQLSYIGLTAYYVAAAVQTIAYARWGRYPLRRWPRALQVAHVLLQSTIVVFPFIVTVVFWALLASPETFATVYSAWANTSIHALNSVFALVELLLTNAPPAPLLALPVQIICLAGYLGVAYITHEAQGFYTYPFLDPSKQHGVLAAYIVGIALGAALVFSLTRGLIMLRMRLVGLMRIRKGSDGLAERDGEGLEEWEEVGRPAENWAAGAAGKEGAGKENGGV
ncbi:hypothetical protein B0H15DRAFT_158086 [Mycena belliarum]|uniref:FAR-17a/AIG1-like protein n=1 Tax=Mycena belliarum TaxID=1033014 RepID=A0AAD6XPG0_9AGAR|nr:hypothetical protein B0H15DRAFT_158086 [Mycena belliae]